MAANTGVGSCIEVPIMAGVTIHGNMGAGKNIEVIVDWESSRCPVRVGGMAGVACCRIVTGCMIWVYRGVVVGQVTSGTGIGRIYITALVTCKAVGGNGSMCSC